MKTNLRSNRYSPIIAFISQCEITLSINFKGKFQTLCQDYSKGIELLLPAQSQKYSKILVVISNDLVLHSRLELPLNLSEDEISEFVSLELSQRGRNTQINTYYDYYLLKNSDNYALISLFEARKDKLDSIIVELKNNGFKVSMIIPQGLVILNQIIRNNDIEGKNYLIICHLGRQILMARISSGELIELNQMHLGTVDDDVSIVAELQAHLVEMECREVITLGLNITELKQHFGNSEFNFVAFQPLSTQSLPGAFLYFANA